MGIYYTNNYTYNLLGVLDYFLDLFNYVIKKKSFFRDVN